MVMDLVQFTLQKLLFVHGLRQYPVLHSFPTRRSSDLSYARHRLGEELATGPAGETGGPSEAPLSRAEALAILGLDEGCDRRQILAAHRRLIQRLHPDRGGSEYLAARINEARELLLRQTDRNSA